MRYEEKLERLQSLEDQLAQRKEDRLNLARFNFPNMLEYVMKEGEKYE